MSPRQTPGARLLRIVWSGEHFKDCKLTEFQYGKYSECWTNTQVPSSDVITSLCAYSSVNEAWKVFVYVNGGASAIGDA